MIRHIDEGYTDEDEVAVEQANIFRTDHCRRRERPYNATCTVQQSEGTNQFSFANFELTTTRLIIELIYELLASMPRSDVAKIHRSMARYLQMDVVGVRYIQKSWYLRCSVSDQLRCCP